MAGMLGASFVPSEENAGQARQNAASEPVSTAIKFLSLRLPRVEGGMSPGALMQPHILSYQGPDPIVAQALEQALGGAGPMGGGMAPPGPSLPAPPVTPPQVTPGEQGPRVSFTGGGSARPPRQYGGPWWKAGQR